MHRQIPLRSTSFSSAFHSTAPRLNVAHFHFNPFTTIPPANKVCSHSLPWLRNLSLALSLKQRSCSMKPFSASGSIPLRSITTRVKRFPQFSTHLRIEKRFDIVIGFKKPTHASYSQIQRQ